MNDLRMALILALAPHRDRLGDEATRSIVREVFGQYQPLDLSIFPVVECGSLVFQAERAANIMNDLHWLHIHHWEETEAYRNGLKLSTARYADGLAEEEAGTMLQLTARAFGKIVGGYRVFIRHSRHTNTPYIQEDALYMTPGVRNGRAALRFVQYMESCVALLGINEIRQDTKVANPAAAKLLDHLGYAHVGNQWVKFLNKSEESSHVQ